MRLKLICAVLVGLLLVVAPGCGSKKKSASTTTTLTTTTSASRGVNLTSTDCANLAAAQATLSGAFSSGKVPANLAAEMTRLNTLAGQVPASIKGDFETLAKVGPTVASLGIKPGQTLTKKQLQTLLSKVDVVKVSTAGAAISAWAATVCPKK
jgi:hypothetical protein